MNSKNRKKGFKIFLLISILFIFGSITAYSQKLGDTNNNGTIDIVDALLIAQYYVGLNPSSFYISAADVNADGTVNIVDALLISQFYVGIITTFPGSTTSTTTSSSTTSSSTTTSSSSSSSSSSSTTSSSTTTTSTGGSTGSCPSSVSCPGNAKCGCEIVSGLGANKKALTNAGASQYMMASAMMETNTMDTNYSFCDGKSGDSCCCGVTKANWYESRTAGASYSDYNSFCNAVNGSRSTDVSNWNRIKSYWGSKYWAVHRNGASGNTNPNTNDINQFKSANDWTNNLIGGHTSDDVRFWVDVQAI